MSFKERFGKVNNRDQGGAAGEARAIAMPVRPRNSVEPFKAEPEIKPVIRDIQEQLRDWQTAYLSARQWLVEWLVVLSVSVLVGYWANWEFTYSALMALWQSAGALALGSALIGAGTALAIWAAMVWRRPSFGRHKTLRAWAKTILSLAIPVLLLWSWANGAYDHIPVVMGGKSLAPWSVVWAFIAGWIGGRTGFACLEILLGKILPRNWQAKGPLIS